MQTITTISLDIARFVATNTPEQQSCLTLHCTRHLSRRLVVGPSLATALIASVADPENLPVRAGLFSLDQACCQAATAHQDRGHRARQQDRQDGMGDHGKRRRAARVLDGAGSRRGG